MIESVDFTPILTAVIYGISFMIICFFATISIVFVRAAMFMEMQSGENDTE